MKAYILDSIERFKRYSKKLDVCVVLCNKSWLVFNDDGVSEIYIFNEDGSMIISNDGIVTNSSWRFISANDSLVISTPSQSYMLKPSFLYKEIFVLQLYGVERYAFLIEETAANILNLKSLSDLQSYFLEAIEKFERETREITENSERAAKEEAEKEEQEVQRENFVRLKKELDDRSDALWKKTHCFKIGRVMAIITLMLSLSSIFFLLCISSEILQIICSWGVVVALILAIPVLYIYVVKEERFRQQLYEREGLPKKYW